MQLDLKRFISTPLDPTPFNRIPSTGAAMLDYNVSSDLCVWILIVIGTRHLNPRASLHVNAGPM